MRQGRCQCAAKGVACCGGVDRRNGKRGLKHAHGAASGLCAAAVGPQGDDNGAAGESHRQLGELLVDGAQRLHRFFQPARHDSQLTGIDHQHIHIGQQPGWQALGRCRIQHHLDTSLLRCLGKCSDCFQRRFQLQQQVAEVSQGRNVCALQMLALQKRIGSRSHGNRVLGIVRHTNKRGAGRHIRQALRVQHHPRLAQRCFNRRSKSIHAQRQQHVGCHTASPRYSHCLVCALATGESAKFPAQHGFTRRGDMRGVHHKIEIGGAGNENHGLIVEKKT